MPEPEPPVPSEPALQETAEHDHEHHEHDHSHEHTAGEDVLKTQRGCGDKCTRCLVCTRKAKAGE